MPGWVQEGYKEYEKRLPRELTPVQINLPLATRSKNSNITKVIAQEGDAMLAKMQRGARVIALDVLGKNISTQTLSKRMADWQLGGQDIEILIGGPDGLDNRCLNNADEKWSLSAMTLPHPLVRVLLIEQLYRAWTLLNNHPYHK